MSISVNPIGNLRCVQVIDLPKHKEVELDMNN